MQGFTSSLQISNVLSLFWILFILLLLLPLPRSAFLSPPLRSTQLFPIYRKSGLECPSTLSLPITHPPRLKAWRSKGKSEAGGKALQLHFTQAVLLSYSDAHTVLFSLWDPDNTRQAVCHRPRALRCSPLKFFFLFISLWIISINHLHVDFAQLYQIY